MRRDLGIDLVRGCGVLMIAVDHLGGLLKLVAGAALTFPFVTWTRIGWSSAAEFFVFFSGYLVGLIYTQTLQKQGLPLAYARAAHRSWQIYVANLVALCAVLILLRLPLFASAPLAAATALDSLASGSLAGLIGFLTLQSAPAFFEILHLYIALLLVAPLLLLVARASVLAALACSVAVWACVQWNPHFNVASWNFNPFAWQLVFVLGMLCSVSNAFERLRTAFGRRRLLLGSGSLLLLALLVKIVDKADWSLPLLGTIQVAGIGRTSVGPLLLLHFLVSVVFVMQIVPRGETIAGSMLGRMLARVGQYSLECFCASTVLVYAAAGWMASTGRFDPFSIFAVGVLIVALVCLWAVVMQGIRSQPWRGKPAAPAPATASTEEGKGDAPAASLAKPTADARRRADIPTEPA